MLPLTGTTNAEHMKQDLESASLALDENVVEAIERLVA
jgi:aryl-alcohol dehydrogenase-like predicted oxidoreductase